MSSSIIREQGGYTLQRITQEDIHSTNRHAHNITIGAALPYIIRFLGNVPDVKP